MAGTVNPNILVLSFVTRGLPSSPFGQGEEILFFRPRRHATDLKIDGSWTFLTLECLFSPNSVYPSVDDGLTPERLSERSLGSSLGLITGGEVLEDGMEPLEPEVRSLLQGKGWTEPVIQEREAQD
ncbi:hypothetical protein BT69DRAFT_1344756 [Atractiella rhizophila]|nr:hypothetical protein BT69DRAFT_1344756 [Atractiella rhizophila]